MNNHDIIWGFEEQFAREVALGSVLSEPQPVWRTLIPGMFIIDQLKRLKRSRTFSARYLFVRGLAFNQLVRAAGVGSSVSDEIATELIRCAKKYGPVSKDPLKLQKELKALVILLSDHYHQLLKAEGNTWFQLTAATYPDQNTYDDFLAKQVAHEESIASAVVFPKIELLRLPVWSVSEKSQLAQRRAKYADMALNE